MIPQAELILLRVSTLLDAQPDEKEQTLKEEISCNVSTAAVDQWIGTYTLFL